MLGILEVEKCAVLWCVFSANDSFVLFANCFVVICVSGLGAFSHYLTDFGVINQSPDATMHY